MMPTRTICTGAVVAVAAVLLTSPAVRSASEAPMVVQSGGGQAQSPVWDLTLTNTSVRSRLGLPDFSAPSADAELRALGAAMADVLWADLEFEQEFYMIPRSESASIPGAPTPATVATERWATLGADYVVHGVLSRAGDAVKVVLRFVPVRAGAAGGQSFAREYGNCQPDLPRACAHYISDDIHNELRQLKGVAQTKLAFVSDRDAQRVRTRPIPESGVSKEIYISDYDGHNQRPVTANRSLTGYPTWAPDGRTLAYMIWTGAAPEAIYLNSMDGRPVRQLLPNDGASYSVPAFSPDGARLAFASNRSGNNDIWVANRDGSGLRQITNHPQIDFSPTWSPNGTQIAFVSERSGSRQIYVVGADGTGLQKLTSASGDVDRPTWSNQNFIAYTSGSFPGHNISLYDIDRQTITQLTDGVGDNQSPAVSPNGRHIAYVTTRWGREQIAIVSRRGGTPRQITTVGTNKSPSWSGQR